MQWQVLVEATVYHIRAPMLKSHIVLWKRS